MKQATRSGFDILRILFYLSSLVVVFFYVKYRNCVTVREQADSYTYREPQNSGTTGATTAVRVRSQATIVPHSREGSALLESVAIDSFAPLGWLVGRLGFPSEAVRTMADPRGGRREKVKINENSSSAGAIEKLPVPHAVRGCELGYHKRRRGMVSNEYRRRRLQKILIDAQATQPPNGERKAGQGEEGEQEGGAQEEGEIQPREMIINEAIHPLRSDSRPRGSAAAEEFAWPGRQTLGFRRFEENRSGRSAIPLVRFPLSLPSIPQTFHLRRPPLVKYGADKKSGLRYF
ncbi:hypothetical protein DBV15_03633 [Temnothorax longispinosus]|uniref:Uncharacterized protein n=1 Tax=Temnothorax longispinosus TaxID=300112 RepID=A0A4S2KKI6_9HYME|nr:hypothetical protein DBV15_03633 [Temnothorax longispinosus]